MIGWLQDPGRRTGIWGIGLPSPMTEFAGKHFSVKIQYPKSWAAFELLHGSHGDMDVIAVIGAPGRSTGPRFWLARKAFPEGSLDDVAQWGIERKVEAETWRGYTPLGTKELNSSSLKGVSHEYSYTSQSPIYGRELIRCLDWYVIQNGYGYALTFCANQDHWSVVYPVFLEMIESFTAE
jgi:hypothetical protein